jgi:membrane-associated phospholipid phosphatase
MLSRLLVLFLFLLPANALQAQSPSTKDCGLKSLQICAFHVAQDEVGIVTAPFHLSGTNFLWIAPFGVATGIALDKDAEVIRNLGIDKSREDTFRKISDYGALYAPVASIGVGYLVGSVTHNDRLQETSVLAGEAMVDSIILNTGLGYAINRQTPMQGDGTGRFWPHGTKTWPDGQSMPSDHSILVWSFAHVVASQYDGFATKALVYSLAATASASRVIAREHFPSDVIVGSSLGYVIGGYVVRRRARESTWNRFSLSAVQTPNGKAMQLSYNFAR